MEKKADPLSGFFKEWLEDLVLERVENVFNARVSVIPKNKNYFFTSPSCICFDAKHTHYNKTKNIF